MAVVCLLVTPTISSPTWGHMPVPVLTPTHRGSSASSHSSSGSVPLPVGTKASNQHSTASAKQGALRLAGWLRGLGGGGESGFGKQDLKHSSSAGRSVAKGPAAHDSVKTDKLLEAIPVCFEWSAPVSLEPAASARPLAVLLHTHNLRPLSAA